MNIEQKKNFLINVAYILVVILIGYGIYKYLLPILAPFLLGALFAYGIVCLSRRMKVDNKWIRILLILLCYVLLGGLISICIIKGIAFLKDVVITIPDFYENQAAPIFELFHQDFTALISEIDPSVISAFESIWENLLGYLSDLISVISKYAVTILSDVASSIPTLFLSTLMMILSSFFFVIDFDNIIQFYQRFVSEKWKKRIDETRLYLTNTIFIVLKSYLLIMIITFSELSVLFLLFRIPNCFLMAAIIAIFDIMPVLGSGGVLLPWAILSLATSNYVQAIKLVVIYGIITCVRNYIEPKIVAGQLGLHPLISLISMFVGLRLFGIAGMFAFPVAISFFWKKYKEKVESEKNSL